MALSGSVLAEVLRNFTSYSLSSPSSFLGVFSNQSTQYESLSMCQDCDNNSRPNSSRVLIIIIIFITNNHIILYLWPPYVIGGAIIFLPCNFYLSIFFFFFLWPPYVIGGIIFLPCNFFLSFFLFSSPNLSGRRLDVYHTFTHGVALAQI